VQRDDQFFEPVERSVPLPVQQRAAVLLGRDRAARQLDVLLAGAEQGRDRRVEGQGEGDELSGRERALATFGLMDRLPAPGAAKDTVHVIADLSRVEFIDSTGLGALIGGLKRLRESGGSLALVVSASRILRIFQLTGLTRVFAVHGTVAAAIGADPHWRQTTEADAGSAEAWCQRYNLS
jgi:anti-sigma B factor antagonist